MTSAEQRRLAVSADPAPLDDPAALLIAAAEQGLKAGKPPEEIFRGLVGGSFKLHELSTLAPPQQYDVWGNSATAGTAATGSSIGTSSNSNEVSSLSAWLTVYTKRLAAVNKQDADRYNAVDDTRRALEQQSFDLTETLAEMATSNQALLLQVNEGAQVIQSNAEMIKQYEYEIVALRGAMEAMVTPERYADLQMTVTLLEDRLKAMVAVEATVTRLEQDLREKASSVLAFKDAAELMGHQLAVAKDEVSRIQEALDQQCAEHAVTARNLAQSKAELMASKAMVEKIEQYVDSPGPPPLAPLPADSGGGDGTPAYSIDGTLPPARVRNSIVRNNTADMINNRPATMTNLITTNNYNSAQATRITAALNSATLAGRRRASPTSAPPAADAGAAQPTYNALLLENAAQPGSTGGYESPQQKRRQQQHGGEASFASPAAQRESQALGQGLLESLVGEDDQYWVGN